MNAANERFLDLLEGDQSDPEVQYELGRCYLTGDGVEQNGAEAEKWLRRAAEQGHEEAAAMLSAASGPAPEAETPLSRETLPDWCLRAEDGDVEAQFRVAVFFLEQGTSTEKQDAERYLKMAARQGHPGACLQLARRWLVQGRLEEAVGLLRNAADCGLWEAAELLGECCSRGSGTARDAAEAERWFIQGAQWGGGEQMLRLALRYARGDCVPASQGRAYSWIKKAEENGCPDARARFDQEQAQYLEEQKQKEAQRAREEEQRRAEEAKRQAEEEQRRAEEEKRQAEEQARQEAEHRQWAAEEAKRQAEERRRESVLQGQRNERAKKVAFWLGAVLMSYAAAGIFFQWLDLSDLVLPRAVEGMVKLFLWENPVILRSLLAVCAAGWYILERSGRQSNVLAIVGGGLLGVQVLLVLARWLSSENSLFGVLIVIVFLGVPYLIWNSVLFYLLLALARFVLCGGLGGQLSWPLHNKMGELVGSLFKTGK